MINIFSIGIFALWVVFFWDLIGAFIKKNLIYAEAPTRIGSLPIADIPIVSSSSTDYDYYINNSSNQCVICYLPVDLGPANENRVHLYCCGSLVHSDHLKKWLKIKKQCPYCSSEKIKLLVTSIHAN